MTLSYIYRLDLFISYAYLELDSTGEGLYRLLYDVQVRTKWDSQVVAAFEVIENLAPDVVHYYMRNKAPWPFSDREFVEKRYTRRRDNGDIEIVYSDAPHPSYQEPDGSKKLERGRTIFGGQIFRRRVSLDTGEPTLLVTLVSQADMNGAVPAKIIKQTLPTSLFKWYRSIKTQLLASN